MLVAVPSYLGGVIHPLLTGTTYLYLSVLRAAAIHLRGSHTATICELLGVTNDESPSVILVDPAGPRSRYAIVCCMHAASRQITYPVCDNVLICNFGIWIDMMVDSG